ncbi:MAG: hypothetical protein ACOVS5_03915 [Oligoflexus sp.]
MERKEGFAASKILIDFIRDFTLLTEQQLLSVRKTMEATVAEVMQYVTGMSNLTSEQKARANEVLVRDSESAAFVPSSAKDLSNKEDAIISSEKSDEVRKNYLENQLMRTGGLFSKHMEALSRVDSDLQALVSRVIGSVSNDDVMAQRLNHITQSLHELEKELTELLANHKSYLTPEAMKKFRNKVLTSIYLSYTSEEEREIFHKIFGHPKELKRVS